MHNFSKLTIITALVLGISAPAMAGTWNSGKNLDGQISGLEQKIKDAQGSSTLTADRASSLESGVAKIRHTQTTFSQGGINAQEQTYLEQEISKLQNQLDRQIG